jgi:hypothetical protein
MQGPKARTNNDGKGKGHRLGKSDTGGQEGKKPENEQKYSPEGGGPRPNAGDGKYTSRAHLTALPVWRWLITRVAISGQVWTGEERVGGEKEKQKRR